jgi:hypothetical protein
LLDVRVHVSWGPKVVFLTVVGAPEKPHKT